MNLMESVKNDLDLIKNTLLFYAPHLMNQLGPTPRKWRDIGKKLLNRRTYIIKTLETNDECTIGTTLYDLAILAHLGERMARDLLSHLNELVKELVPKLNPEILSKLKKEMLPLFTNFDNSKSDCLNKIGELSAINHVLKDPSFKLLDLEIHIPGLNTKLDLLLGDEDGNKTPVEIVNIYVNETRWKTDEDVNIFLSGRVKDKISQKVGMDLPLPFPLLIVLWCFDLDKLVQFSKVITSRSNPEALELPICCLFQFSGNTGEKSWQFMSLHQFCDSYKSNIDSRTQRKGM